VGFQTLKRVIPSMVNAPGSCGKAEVLGGLQRMAHNTNEMRSYSYSPEPCRSWGPCSSCASGAANGQTLAANEVGGIITWSYGQ
jgi:hypothetical protein